jgi:F-type H+-transporting ATPase subunit alpha
MQIAIVYCGSKELLRNVPVEKVKAFETEFLEILQMQHRNLLDELKIGNLTEATEQTLRKVAEEVAEKFKK